MKAQLPHQDPNVCKHADNELFGVECAGPMQEIRRYFTDGQSLYACEAHAKAAREVNPFGPQFTPVAGDSNSPGGES